MSIFVDSKPSFRVPVSIWEPPPPIPPERFVNLYLASAGENRAFVNILADWIVHTNREINVVSRWHVLPPSDDLHLRMLVDRTDLEKATALLLVEPCGVNSSGEFSWAVAKGIPTIYYQDKYLSDDVLNMSALASFRVEDCWQLTAALSQVCNTARPKEV